MDFFYLLLQASFISVFAIIFVLFLRTVLKDKLDRRVFILLWAIIIFRLIVVDSVASPVSFSQFVPWHVIESNLPLQQNANTAYPDRSSSTADTAGNVSVPATMPQMHENIEEKANIPWLFSIWLVGVTAMITGTFMLYMLFQFKSRNIIRLKDIGYEKELGKTDVFLSDQITSPVTIGIINPQIHLPDTIDFREKEALRHVLIHEMTHIKRYDNLLKLVMMLALSLHWFNPLVWILCRTLNKDIECSCDEATIKAIGEKSKADYANTLLKMAETSNVANVAGLVFVSFESSFLRERVINIMKKRYPTALSAVAAVVLSVGMFAVFATNAQATDISSGFDETARVLVLKEKADPAEKETIETDDLNVQSISFIKIVEPNEEKEVVPKTAGDIWLSEHTPFTAANSDEIVKTRLLTADEAKDIALKIVGGGQVVKLEFENDKKRPEYEIDIIKDNAEYDIEMDAYSGEILEYEKKDISGGKKTTWLQGMVTVEQAREIVLKQTGEDVTIVKCTLDSKKGHENAFYAIEARSDKTKYKYHIDAYTGEILKAEASQ